MTDAGRSVGEIRGAGNRCKHRCTSRRRSPRRSVSRARVGSFQPPSTPRPRPPRVDRPRYPCASLFPLPRASSHGIGVAVQRGGDAPRGSAGSVRPLSDALRAARAARSRRSSDCRGRSDYRSLSASRSARIGRVWPCRAMPCRCSSALTLKSPDSAASWSRSSENSAVRSNDTDGLSHCDGSKTTDEPGRRIREWLDQVSSAGNSGRVSRRSCTSSCSQIPA